MDKYILVFDIIGTIAFAISGALVAIEKKMDLLGVIILGIVTAVGGGIIRDLTLGITPPLTFCNPRSIMLAIVTSIITFIGAWLYIKHYVSVMKPLDALLFISDTVGLGVFTVVGVQTAVEKISMPSSILLIFVGVITGVGGGVVRDLLAGNIPYILKKHIYACASIGGAMVCMLLWQDFGKEAAMFCGAVVVVLIRILASHYKWNLPKIHIK